MEGGIVSDPSAQGKVAPKLPFDLSAHLGARIGPPKKGPRAPRGGAG